MLDMLRSAGIGTGAITRDPERTVGLYTIQTDEDGERSFSYWRSDSAARGLAEDGEHLLAALTGSDLVYLSGITLAILSPVARDRLMASVAPGHFEWHSIRISGPGFGLTLPRQVMR